MPTRLSSVTLRGMPLPVRVRARLAAAAALLAALVVLAVPAMAPAQERVLLGEGTVQPSTDSNPNGMAEAFSTLAGASGSLDELRVYVDGCSRATTLTAGLYTDADGHPGRRLTEGSIASPRPGAWNAVRVPAADVTAGQTYWIAILGTGGGPLCFRDRAGGGGAAETSAELTLQSLPAQWQTGTKYPDGPLSATGVATAAAPQPAELAVTPGALTFDATLQAGGGVSKPVAQTLRVANAGDGALSFTASDDAGWLTVSPAAGDAPGDLTVAVDATGLREGRYSGEVTVTAAGAAGSPRVVPITLVVSPEPPPLPSIPKPGLVGAWGFEEGAGTEATDLSGWSNDGTLADGVQRVAGRFGAGLELSGADEWVEVPDSRRLDFTTQLTLEAWVRPASAAPGWSTVLFKEQPSGFAYALYASTDAGVPSSYLFAGGPVGLDGPAALPAGAWSHVATTYDGATVRLYVDGAEVASRPQTGAVSTSDGPLHIGGNDVWGEWFEGRVDEVRVYRRALAASEIASDVRTPIQAP